MNRILSGSSQGSTGALAWGENYTIDPWSNLTIAPMTGKTHGGNFPCAGDNLNRATCLSYDAAGNVTANGAIHYNYDQENRLLSTASTTYTYDADGERVEKSNGTTGTLYWYGTPGIIAESDLSGNLTAEYVFFGGKRIARIDLPAGSVHYYLSDHLNSTSMVVNSSGVTEEDSDYSPYGTEFAAISPGPNHYKFNGKERDAESCAAGACLDYFGARYFPSTLGRWMSPDWAAKATAVPYANFGNPQSLNLYAYVENNPTTLADVDGHLAGSPTSNSPPFDCWNSCLNGGIHYGEFCGLDFGPCPPPPDTPPFHKPGESTLCKLCEESGQGQQAPKQEQSKEDRLTNVTYNETGSLRGNSKLKPGTPGSSEDLHTARVEVAEVAERVLDSEHPNRVQASDVLTAQAQAALAGGNKPVIAALNDSRSAARAALSGSNLSRGAMHYRTSHHILRKLYGRRAVHFGPFPDALGGKTYIMVAP